MDLDHRDLRGHGNRVLNRYLEESGDLEGLALLPLFLSTRAAVRAKVSASIAATVSDPDDREAHRSEARAYLAMALDYFEPAPPRLVAIGGLSGTGKTTVARGVAPSPGRVARSGGAAFRRHPQAAAWNTPHRTVARERLRPRHVGGGLSRHRPPRSRGAVRRPCRRRRCGLLPGRRSARRSRPWRPRPACRSTASGWRRLSRSWPSGSAGGRATRRTRTGRWSRSRPVMTWVGSTGTGSTPRAGPDDSADGAWVVLSGEAAADPA